MVYILLVLSFDLESRQLHFQCRSCDFACSVPCLLLVCKSPFRLKSQRVRNPFTMTDLDSSTAAGNNGKSTYQMEENTDGQSALREVQPAGNISMSPELFEKLYLSPKNHVSNNLRTTFGNPTPL